MGEGGKQRNKTAVKEELSLESESHAQCLKWEKNKCQYSPAFML